MLLGCVGFAAVCPPAVARDYGQVGAVFPVIEPDLLRVIEARLKSMQASGQIDVMNQRLADRTRTKVNRPDPVAGIDPAIRSRSWLYDPSIIIDHDIRDHKGQLIAAAGTRVNPLDYVVIKTPLVFIDGDDAAQLAWAMQRFSNSAKLILVRGAPLELMTKRQRRFYFDQSGTLTTKFGISHVPAVVEQAGRVMRVTEMPVGAKKS
ncbi:type-F conjugative transfer system protein TraW [Sphingomonas sp. SUN039]|nr:type-F conjugative transfer system protein TraW [Sphingomonas sp. SUN039]